MVYIVLMSPSPTFIWNRTVPRGLVWKRCSTLLSWCASWHQTNVTGGELNSGAAAISANILPMYLGGVCKSPSTNVKTFFSWCHKHICLWHQANIFSICSKNLSKILRLNILHNKYHTKENYIRISKDLFFKDRLFSKLLHAQKFVWKI